MTSVNEEKTAVHSNAFNFRSFVQSGVDPRTGLYTVGLSLHDVEVNDLRGPVIPLSLNYNPIGSINNGFGSGWRVAMTEYRPSTQIITTHSGESFKVTGNYAGEGDPRRLKMKEQKIQSFKLYELFNDPLGHFKVVHTSGLVEILKLTGTSPQVAMPVKMYSAQGHEATLDYQSAGGGRMLNTVKDSQGTLLQVVSNLVAGTVEIRLRPVQNVPLAVFTLQLEGDRMTRITLPTDNNAGWRFVYGLEREQLCIKEVWTPLGGHETIQYNDGGHGFPGNPGYPNLPRVTDHITNPGAGQPPVTVKYTYSANGNNFLGRNAPIDWTDDGQDNLYKVIGAYLYESTESLMVANAAVRTVKRTFNRFHLLTSEVTTQGTHQQKVTTTYYANDTDTFDNQVPQCQLPRKVVTRWELIDDPRDWREDTELSEYDIHGNQTLRMQANGITETMSYYPAEGVAGEWKDPYGFVRHLRESTVTPASDPALVADLEDVAPTLCTRYRYVEQSPISGSATPWIALAEEDLLELNGQAETLLERTVNTYIQQPDNAFLHGQIERTAVIRGDAPSYTTYTDFAYSKESATYTTLADETVLRTVQTLSSNFDNVSKIITEERSFISGLPLLSSDKDVKIRNTYDALGRVLTETVAPDSTVNSATRTYSYRLIRPADQGQTPVTYQASQEVENVKGVKTRTLFDGLNRAVKEELEDVDNAGGQPSAFRGIYEAAYNALGELTQETEIDWLEKKDLRQTSTFTYDLWGQQNSVIAPDGVKSFTHNNPITFRSEEWIEGMGKTVTVSNRFEKPVSVERFDLADKRISLHSYKYDGLGRTASEKNAGGFETFYKYDAHDRMVETTLPDRAKVVRQYAGHSRGDFPTLISVNGKVLGTQAFDVLERMTRSVTGGRVTTYEYDSSNSQPARVVRPSGDVIAYEYMPELTEEPTKRTTIPKTAALAPIEAKYDYDRKNARLLESTEQGLTLLRTYSSSGEVATEKRDQDGDSYEMVYLYSRMGRLLRYTDVLGQVQHYEHDDKGRMVWTELGSAGTPGHVKSEFTYNDQGLTTRIHTVDSAAQQSLTINLEYDAHGRETLRVFDFGNAAQRLSQTWNGLDQVERRLLSEGAEAGGATLRDEKYEYELRGRLEYYTCTGPQSPVDPYGKTIQEQEFYFDAMDNLEEVRTHFDGGSNVAKFFYENEDPAQLSAITNTLYPDVELNYDDNGNLLQDREWALGYDSLGRLATVSSIDGGSPKAYGYDGEDTLSNVRGDSSNEQLFYRGDEPANRIDGDQQSTFVFGSGVALAERQSGAGPKS